LAEGREIAGVIGTMDHSMTIRTQHCEVRCNVVLDRDAFLERRNWPEMMCFDKALSDIAVSFRKI
jgi:hypothetical protein